MSTENKQAKSEQSLESDSIRVGDIGAGAGVAIGRGAHATVTLSFSDHTHLRQWWHELLRNYGRYACYAVLLALPSDKEAIRYLTDFGMELHLISGKECLIIALTKTEFKIYEFFDEKAWIEMIHEHVIEGFSIEVANALDIDITLCPCLAVFQDIRSPERVVISLRDMTAEEIAKRMRVVFSTIHKAVSEKQSSLTALKIYQAKDSIGKTGQAFANKVGALSEKTFEKAMEALVKAVIK